MKSPLDRIETSLQNLFESSLHLFPGADLHHQLAGQFASAMKDNIIIAEDGSGIAPDQFVLCLHPDAFNYWHSDPLLLEFLANALQEAASQNSILFTNKPVITLSANLSLTPDQIQVIATPADLPQTQTVDAANPQPTIPDSRPTNAFLILSNSKIFPLTIHVINIGRRSDNQLVIEDARVSRIHAQLRARQGKFILFDLNSSGGTFVNGQRISQVTLNPGDVISLAGVAMIYGEDTPASLKPTHPTIELPPVGKTKPNQVEK